MNQLSENLELEEAMFRARLRAALGLPLDQDDTMNPSAEDYRVLLKKRKPGSFLREIFNEAGYEDLMKQTRIRR